MPYVTRRTGKQSRTADAFAGEVTDEQARAIYQLTKFGPTAFNS